MCDVVGCRVWQSGLGPLLSVVKPISERRTEPGILTLNALIFSAITQAHAFVSWLIGVQFKHESLVFAESCTFSEGEPLVGLGLVGHVGPVQTTLLLREELAHNSHFWFSLVGTVFRHILLLINFY